jgi:hypothetical protein
MVCIGSRVVAFSILHRSTMNKRIFQHDRCVDFYMSLVQAIDRSHGKCPAIFDFLCLNLLGALHSSQISTMY